MILGKVMTARPMNKPLQLRESKMKVDEGRLMPSKKGEEAKIKMGWC